MENVEIITLQPTDWQEYRDLRLKALKEEPQAFGSSYEDNAKHSDEFWQERLKAAQLGKTQWLVFAESNDDLVGMVGAFAEKDPEDAHVVAVYVIPEFRGKGISKLLMNELISKIKMNPVVKKITVDVNPEQIPALNLYKKSGFSISKKYNQTLGDGKKHDTHQMVMIV